MNQSQTAPDSGACAFFLSPVGAAPCGSFLDLARISVDRIKQAAPRGELVSLSSLLSLVGDSYVHHTYRSASTGRADAIHVGIEGS